MQEWWSYRPGDFLLFSPGTYWRLFQLATSHSAWNRLVRLNPIWRSGHLLSGDYPASSRCTSPLLPFYLV